MLLSLASFKSYLLNNGLDSLGAVPKNPIEFESDGGAHEKHR